MTRAARIPGVVAGVVFLLVMRWMSAVPVSTTAGDDAVLRVAFRLRPERVEVCRDRTPEELAGVPVHMRQLQVCIGQSATYRLEVSRDREVLVDEIVHGGGLRHDRPIYASREWTVRPGPGEVEVRLARQEVLPPEQAARGMPPLALKRRVTFVPRQVVLVTYDAEHRVLEVRGETSQGP
jgi:hypothetical protein